jgi:hypothetical protein
MALAFRNRWNYSGMRRLCALTKLKPKTKDKNMRTSIKTLETLCRWINERTGSPLEPYTKDENGNLRANVGNYHLSGAYGGWCLHRMHSEGGGVTTPLIHGHVPKRELETAMRAFLAGIDTVRESN